jgi:hypothetical protein
MRSALRLVSKVVLAPVAAAALAGAPSACSNDLTTQSPPPSQLAAPSRNDFPAVGDAMQLHCGTLDCHGQIGRNMRLYGQFGRRLDPANDPLTEPTTDEEYTATYQSIVALEPEAMSAVVQGQASPGTLTMVRKPLGLEEHKGGVLFQSGDDLYRCIVGWVRGQFDANACSMVVDTPRPELDAGQ